MYSKSEYTNNVYMIAFRNFFINFTPLLNSDETGSKTYSQITLI